MQSLIIFFHSEITFLSFGTHAIFSIPWVIFPFLSRNQTTRITKGIRFFFCFPVISSITYFRKLISSTLAFLPYNASQVFRWRKVLFVFKVLICSVILIIHKHGILDACVSLNQRSSKSPSSKLLHCHFVFWGFLGNFPCLALLKDTVPVCVIGFSLFLVFGYKQFAIFTTNHNELTTLPCSNHFRCVIF